MTERNLSSPPLLLIGLAALIFLLAALGLFLLQAPSSARPEGAAASPSAAATTGLPLAAVSLPPTLTPRTSYTPFATRLTLPAVTEAPVITISPTPSPGSGTASSTASAMPYPGPGTQVIPTASPTTALLPGTPSPTVTITSTPTSGPTTTLAAGETGISGRVVQNGTPLAGITVEFRDDQPARTAVTDSEGRYWFKTMAIGADFTLTFDQTANPQLTTSTPIAYIALMYGYLPAGSQVISLPDLEISLVLNGQTFEATSPADGAAYSAATITSANPVPFVWTAYNQADMYYVELTTAETDEILWGSENTTSTTVMFDGTLDDGTNISAGSYRWLVAASRPTGNYRLVVYTRPRSLLVNP
jgi:hypothetical protein